MNKQPLLTLLCFFMSGILLRENFALQDEVAHLSLLVGTILAFSIIFKNFWIQKLKPWLLGLFFFSLGLFSHHLNSEKPLLQSFVGKQDVAFQIDKKLNSTEKYRRYEIEVLKLNDKSASLKAIINIPKDEPQLDFKNYYQTEAYLNLVEHPSNNFQFDYAQYLSRRNIYYQSFINSEIKEAKKDHLAISESIKQKRLDVLRKIDSSNLSKNSREFTKGIILADRTEMDAETVTDFNKSGLVHLLAISGTHMVIIFGLIMFLLNKIVPSQQRKWSIFIALVLIWTFAVFIDYGSSVMRSCIMITAYYGFVLLQRKPDLLHAMALAGFLILIVDTHQFFDVGFQLSFLAVLGIYWLNQPILSFFGRITNRYKRFAVNVFSVSLSAQLATLPLVLYYFHQYSLISIVANLVIIPWSEVIIVFSLLMTVLIAFGFEFSLLNWLYDGLVRHLLKTIHFFAGVDSLFSDKIPMSVLEALILLICLYFLRKIFIQKNWQSAIPFMASLFMFFFVRTSVGILNFRRDEIIVANYFKEKVLMIKKGNEADLYFKTTEDSNKIKRYIANPYQTSRRLQKINLKNLPEDVETIAVADKIYHLQ